MVEIRKIIIKMRKVIAMNSNNTRELKEFSRNFNVYRDKKIVLYGIGRYASLIATQIEGFHFVGFMDKNIEKIGEYHLGIPILSQEEAEAIADLVIIATSEDYWDVIYQRIKDFKLPIYFSNGQKASTTLLNTNLFEEYKFEKKELLGLIEKADVVSFDFFDTLFMRSVAEPLYVFELLALEVGKKNIVELRNQALKHMKLYYTFEELYDEIRKVSNSSMEEIEKIKNKEIEIEKRLIKPRNDIFDIFREVLDKKEVWIVSEMYLPKEFYTSLLNSYGIVISEEHILVSSECKCSKTDGTIYTKLKSYNENKNILHIGDNKKLDGDIPLQYGIQTYHVPNVWELCNKSTISDINPQVTDLYSSAIWGLQLQKIFNSPYSNNSRVKISTNQEMGYCIYGPVVLTFLLWLRERTQQDNIKKIIFFARDGYFLEKNYVLLDNLLGINFPKEYLGISRKLSIIASINTKEELIDYINMPYVGTMKQRLEDRLEFMNGIKEPIESIETYIENNKDEIWNNLKRIKKNYLSYLEQFELNNNCAIVDLGTEGTCQRYLNKLLGLKMSGYYFRANLSESNDNLNFQKMIPCFQKDDDKLAKNSFISKKILYLEAFLTAPYGMIKEVDENGEFICSSKKQNQIYFSTREQMNQGVEQFIIDYIKYFGKANIKPNIKFIDQYYGIMMSDKVIIDDGIKKTFYHDNELMGRNESALFY